MRLPNLDGQVSWLTAMMFSTTSTPGKVSLVLKIYMIVNLLRSNYRKVNVVRSKFGIGKKNKTCTHAKFRKYAQNRGRALCLSTLLVFRKSTVFYSCTLAAVNNTDYGSGGQTDPDPTAVGTSGMPEGLAAGHMARQAPFWDPS